LNNPDIKVKPTISPLGINSPTTEYFLTFFSSTVASKGLRWAKQLSIYYDKLSIGDDISMKSSNVQININNVCDLINHIK
jgi:hypothetical protein